MEATRGNHETAVAACRRSREQAPDRVSRAYASMVLGYALLGLGDHVQARTILEPIVAELERFGFPQWNGFAAALTAETYRLDDRLDLAATFVGRALEDAAIAFDRSARTFERIGAAFEAQLTRCEISTLTPD